jgi:hypothetical protein
MRDHEKSLKSIDEWQEPHPLVAQQSHAGSSPGSILDTAVQKCCFCPQPAGPGSTSITANPARSRSRRARALATALAADSRDLSVWRHTLNSRERCSR